jgi:hypothetical protein
MDLQRILSQLHEERRRVNDVILTLERLADGLGKRRSLTRASAALAEEISKEQPLKKKPGRKKKSGGEG